MKIIPLSLLLFVSPVASFPAHACGCCDDEACPAPVGETATKDAVKGHPLKGVIVDVLSDQSALLVKHEEVPGVMKAMTMLLKVDAAALSSAKKGQTVTGLLVRKADGWWLDEVKSVAATE
jgi:Cu/Ag efflux protein CusF